MRRRITSMILALAIAASLLPRAAAAEAVGGTIHLPASLERGSMTVTRNGTPLSNGDSVTVGDTLNFTVTPAEGYAQMGGVTSGEKTLTADDFSLSSPLTVDAAANSGWTWTNNYYGHSGYTVVIPRSSIDEPRSFTHTETFPAGNVEISFDWAVNQGYTYYGQFMLKFYHNDELKISHDFTETANPMRRSSTTPTALPPTAAKIPSAGTLQERTGASGATTTAAGRCISRISKEPPTHTNMLRRRRSLPKRERSSFPKWSTA